MFSPAEPGLDVLAAGEPDYTDSCDADSMCWSGQLTPDPFVGVCLAFCQSQLDPVCPEGSTCESVADELELCVPAP